MQYRPEYINFVPIQPYYIGQFMNNLDVDLAMDFASYNLAYKATISCYRQDEVIISVVDTNNPTQTTQIIIDTRQPHIARFERSGICVPTRKIANYVTREMSSY